MNRYITEVFYIDVRTGEYVTKKELGNRNFLGIKEEIKFKIENGITTRTITHYGVIGSACEADCQLRLL